MKNGTQRRNYEPYKVILFVAGIVAVVALAHSMKEVFAAVTVALVFFYILDPFATFFTGKKIFRNVKITRVWGSVIALIIGIGAITLFFVILIPPVVDQVERLVKNLPDYMNRADEAVQHLQQRYNRLAIPPVVQESLKNTMNTVVSESTKAVQHAFSSMSKFFSQLVLSFMIPFLTFYLLIEKDDVKETLAHVFPKRFQEEARLLVHQSSHALRGYISGQLLLSFIMGVGMTITLGLMGIKAPLLLGMIAGVTKLIPVIGIILGCIPAAFVALAVSTKMAVWVVVIFTVVQLLENKIILPVLLSKYVDLSPLTILCALLIGEQLGGVLGMFVATPIMAVMKVIYLHVRQKYE